MKKSFVPEARRDPAGNPPYSLACVPPTDARVLPPFAGSIAPGHATLADEVTAVLGKVFTNVRAAGFTPDDICFITIIVGGGLSLEDEEVVVTVNAAYVSAFKEAGVATTPESVLPCRAAFASPTLMARALFEAVPVVVAP